MFFRFNKDGDFYWKLTDLGGGSGTFLNGSKCVPHVEYSLKTKDIIGVATSDEESVREGDNTTFVYEIMSPTSILENCRKFGVEESIIETCRQKHQQASLKQSTAEVDKESDYSLTMTIDKESRIDDLRNAFSDIDSDEEDADCITNPTNALSDIDSDDGFHEIKIEENATKTEINLPSTTENENISRDDEEDCSIKIVSVESNISSSTESERDVNSPVVSFVKPNMEAVKVDKNPSLTSPLQATKHFKCPHCSKVFQKYKKLLKHVKRRHDNYSVENSTSDTLKLTVKKTKVAPGLMADTWNKSVQNRTKLRCRKCSVETIFQERRGLYIHYALRHYKEEICDKLGDNEKYCPEDGCGVKKKLKNDLIAHLATDHNYVETFMPKDWRIPYNDVVNNDKSNEDQHDTDTTITSTDTEESDNELPVRPVPKVSLTKITNKEIPSSSQTSKSENQIKTTVATTTKIQMPPSTTIGTQCSICPKQCRDRSDLLAHYSILHFKGELMKQMELLGYVDEKNSCPLCTVKLRDKTSLVRHFGVVHKMVLKFVNLKMEQSKSNLAASNIQVNEVHNQIGTQLNKTELHQEKRTHFSKTECTSWSCHFCAVPPFKEKRSLHYHISGVHFKDQIKAILGDTDICPEPDCGKQVSKYSDLIRHVGVVHRYLDRFLPDFLLDSPQNYEESVPAEPNQPKLTISLKNKRKITDSDKESDEECDNDWNPSGSTRKKIKVDQEKKYLSYKKFAKKESTLASPNPGSMTCHICFLKTGRTFSSRAKLYEHYSVVHYKEELEFKFGTKFSKFCPECGHPKENLIGHLGATHNKVEQFLPKPFHVPMTKQSRIINSRSPTQSPQPGSSSTTPIPHGNMDSEDDQLVSELDAKLSAVWNVAQDKSDSIPNIDHCYLVKLQESDSPEDTPIAMPKSITPESQKTLTHKETNFITLSEDVDQEQDITSLLE